MSPEMISHKVHHINVFIVLKCLQKLWPIDKALFRFLERTNYQSDGFIILPLSSMFGCNSMTNWSTGWTNRTQNFLVSYQGKWKECICIFICPFCPNCRFWTLYHIGHIGTGVFFLACPVYHRVVRAGFYGWLLSVMYL